MPFWTRRRPPASVLPGAYTRALFRRAPRRTKTPRRTITLNKSQPPMPMAIRPGSSRGCLCRCCCYCFCCLYRCCCCLNKIKTSELRLSAPSSARLPLGLASAVPRPSGIRRPPRAMYPGPPKISERRESSRERSQIANRSNYYLRARPARTRMRRRFVVSLGSNVP